MDFACRSLQQEKTAKRARFALTTDIKLTLGKRVFDYIRKVIPTKAERRQYYFPLETKRLQYYHVHWRIPRGFWHGFFRTELASKPTKARRMMYRRCFEFFMKSKRTGAAGNNRLPAKPRGPH